MEKFNILFVDDDENFCKSMKVLFKTKYTVLTAHTAAAALEIIQNQPVHLCFLDYHLPDQNGDELLLEVRRIRWNLKVVFLTAHPSVELRNKVSSKPYSVCEFLPKCCDIKFPDYLMQTAEHHVSNQLRRQNPPDTPCSGLKDKILERRKRLFELAELIKDHPERWTVRGLAIRLGVSKSQIQSDINALRKPKHNMVSAVTGFSYSPIFFSNLSPLQI